ncbi:hypothetical protein K438DRAFT_1648882 [Mycena galopus ATCC 62051]|nr:hypothetical protein K438DRAFT_1648882 [Mycena galopus ATCC 62051]
MLIGRPAENPIPPSLLDQTLGEFRHNISTIEPTTRDFIDFLALRAAMVKIYSNKGERQRALIQVLGQILPGSPFPGTIRNYTNDGELFFVHLHCKFYFYLQEIKNELRNISSEPSFELVGYYVEQCRICHEKVPHCNLPAILLCQCGPYLLVGCGVFVHKPIVEQFVALPLNAYSSDVYQTAVGARVIAALRRASSDLSKRYPELVQDKTRQPEYPYPRNFPVAGSMATLAYRDSRPGKLVFRADWTPGPGQKPEACYVKFTLRHNEKLYDLALGYNLAPPLIHFQRVHEWFMIVTKDMSKDYTTIAELNDAMHVDEAPQGNIERDPENVMTRVTTALQNLHRAGFVHGNVRDVNVLVRNAMSDGSADIILVDWDWAGKEGDVKYPANLNPAVPRGPGAVAGEPILQSHDIDMVRRLYDP